MRVPHFARRFGYLLWKNILWKVRNWPGTLLELIFPTLLFILLISLRSQNPPELVPIHHRAAKALPSAGLIPFLQTVYCDTDNDFSNRPDGLPDFKGSKVDVLYLKLAKLFNRTSSPLGDTNRFQDTYRQLSRWLDGEDSSDPAPPEDPDNSLNRTISRLCGSAKNGTQSLKTLLGLDSSVCNSDNVVDKTSNLTSAQRRLLYTVASLSGNTDSGNLSSLLAVYREEKEDLEATNALGELFSDMKTTLCGNQSTGSSALLKAFASNTPLSTTSNNTDTPPIPPNSTNSTRNHTSAGLFDSGVRIIFSPNNSLAWGIIHEMNTTFHYVDVIRDLLHSILRQNRELRRLLDSYSQRDEDRTLVGSLRELATSQRENRVEGLPSAEDLTTAAQLLDRNFTNNLWNISQWIEGNASHALESPVFKISWDFFRGFASEEELVTIATSHEERDRLGIKYVIAGIVFQNLPSNTSRLPAQVRYKIRSRGYSVEDPNRLRRLSWRPGADDNNPLYLVSGFIFLQDLVERAIINQEFNASINSPGGYVQPFPYPCYINDDFLLVLQGVLPLVLVISGSLAVSMLARVLTHEKEQRLQDILSIMGVGVAEHWCSWMVVYFFLLLPPTCFNWAVLSWGGILPYSDSFLLLLLFLSYNLSLMAFAILASVPFKKANLAGSATGLLYFLLFFLTPVVEYLEFSLELWEILLVLLFSPSALGIYTYYNVQWDVQTVGIHWTNLHMSPVNTDKANPLVCWVFMLLDAFLYLCLAYYLQAVLPGTYGVRRSWFFPVDPRYWLGDRRARRIWHFLTRTRTSRYSHLREEELVEEEGDRWEVLAEEEGPEHLTKGVEINRMDMTYSWGLCGRNKVSALHCLSLDLYEGQITTLLGHNGAGKTSLMMILSGVFSPTAGDATIYGKSLSRDIGELRKRCIGLCPQHNILYNHMTVDEHLLFFGAIRGLRKEEIRMEATLLLTSMRLLEHRGKKIDQLSGGMRRKLCVCLSFLGSPKLVILDEPTAGIDPYSRRHIWDFLMSQRGSRCILLSTHHMDEAEVVGDRIAILDHGHLLCVGGLPFLKQQFQLKYVLKVERRNDTETQGVEITELVERYVPSAKAVEVGEETHFSVPISVVREDEKLTQLFSQLEQRQQALGVSSYGFEAPTLEQLFLKLTEMRYTEDSPQKDEPPVPDHVNTSISPLEGPHRVPRLLTRVWVQWYALFLKRLHNARRDLRGFILQYFLFLLVLVLTLWVSSLSPYPTNHGKLTLSPSLYERISLPNHFVLLGSNGSIDPDYPTAESYLDTIVCPGGLGVPPNYTYLPSDTSYTPQNTTSPGDWRSPLTCPWYPNQKWSSLNWLNRSQEARLVNTTCSCDTGEYVCPQDAYGPLPGALRALGDGSVLLDVRGRNLTDYLLKRQRDYIQKLYGGESFGLLRDDVPRVNGDVRDFVNRNIRDNNDRISYEALVEREYSKAWFSFKGLHAMPIFLNVMNNAIYRRELVALWRVSRNLSEYGIVATSEPWPPTPQELVLKEIRSGKPLMMPLLALFGFCFLASSFVLFVLEEKISGTKHLQSISGLNTLLYWSSSYLWDLVIYLLAISLGSLVFLCFREWAFVSPSHFPVFLAACVAFGAASISLTYIVTWIFDSPSKAYVVLFCFSYVAGMIFMVVDYSYDFINKDKNKELSLILENVFLLFPSYAFVKVLYELLLLYIQEAFDLEFGVQLNTTVFGTEQRSGSQLYQFDLIWKYILAMLLEAAILFVLNVLIDICVNFSISHPLFRIAVRKREELEDNDVADEERRVVERPGDNILSLQHLYKRYFGVSDLVRPCLPGNKPTRAVRNLTLGVKKECFGLLGLNGAGKTSVFNMITGVRSITSGSIKISGRNIHLARLRAYSRLGYCAQFDSLFPLLTAREHLQVYGMLRGMSGRALKDRVNQLISRLYLTEYADLPAGRYSGGNKRKLSTAIALVSRPSLLLLDEPTAGIDPYAKQFLWKVIRDLTQEGVASMLTTHSMSECEALCTRIGIMKEGHLQCIGSPQHLKSKYGKGYVMKFYLSPAQDQEGLLEEIRRRLPYAHLSNSHQSLLQFRLEGDFKLSDTLSQVFRLREDFKDQVEEFSIGQTTLDDVFLRIVSDGTNTCQATFQSDDVEMHPIN